MSTAALVLTLSAALAPTPGLLISPADLAAEMKDPSLVILHADMRFPDFATGHIKGARFIGYKQITIDGPTGVGSELPPAADLVAVFEAAGVTDLSHVVIYGPPLAATRAFFTLDYLGHKNVRVLNGGLAAWKSQGLEIEQGAKGARVPRVPRVLASLHIRGLMLSPWPTGSRGGSKAHGWRLSTRAPMESSVETMAG